MKRLMIALLFAAPAWAQGPRFPPPVPPGRAPTAAEDPLTNYYDNTLISEKLTGISAYGGAAHVWLYPDHHFVSFDVSTGGRYGKYYVTAQPGVLGGWDLCMGYSFATVCYPIDKRKVGETWVIRDPDALSLNSLVPGHQ